MLLTSSYIFLLHRVWCPNLLTVVGYPGPGPVLNTCERLKRTASASGVRFGELSRSVFKGPIRSGKTKWSTAVGFRKLWGQLSRWRIFSEDKSNYWIITGHLPIELPHSDSCNPSPKHTQTTRHLGPVWWSCPRKANQFWSIQIFVCPGERNFLERGILMVFLEILSRMVGQWLKCWMFAVVAPQLCHDRMKTWPWPSQLPEKTVRVVYSGIRIL